MPIEIGSSIEIELAVLIRPAKIPIIEKEISDLTEWIGNMGKPESRLVLGRVRDLESGFSGLLLVSAFCISLRGSGFSTV